MRSARAARIGAAALLLAGAFSVGSCNDRSNPADQQTLRPNVDQHAIANAAVDWSNQPIHVQKAIDVQNRHTNELMALPGVIGTGTGLNESNPNEAQIVVFTDHDGVRGIPAFIEGHKTRIEMVGKVTPFTGYAGSYDPVPMGVSTGNDLECAAGTIGCMISNAAGLFLLSNNHVFARENDAARGERIDQSGRYDAVNCGHPRQVASLSDFEPVSSTTDNLFDAAIAAPTPGVVFNYAEAGGYTLSGNWVQPRAGMKVKKSGRTTGLTTGSISAINVSLTVAYTKFNAHFINQIYVKGSFIRAGDSGSLMVTQNGNDAVGLDFAGGSGGSFANPIGPILTRFNATIVK